jgi:hypothetical protein
MQHGGNVLLAAGFLLGGAGLSSRAQKSEETSAARLMDHLMWNRVATLALIIAAIVHGGGWGIIGFWKTTPCKVAELISF